MHHRHSSTSVSAPDTPEMRTGPPRTLSYVYSLPGSPPLSRINSSSNYPQNGDIFPGIPLEGEEFPFHSDPKTSREFRGALEVGSPTNPDRRAKKRESKFLEDNWNPMKWFQEQKEEKSAPENQKHRPKQLKIDTDQSGPQAESGPFSAFPENEGSSKSPPNVRLRRAFSDPHAQNKENKAGRTKWGRLRSLIPSVVNAGSTTTPGPSAVISHSVNITDEVITGGLSTLMLRLWFERDEKGHRRIPVLLHRLRIRISDSLHPLHGNKSVFRIKCEYANGAARWVIYRTLRDFISLHAHYAVSNAYNRNVNRLPEFPRTSLPYFKFLKKESRKQGDKVHQADFARIQRETLENYLLDLIRAVMFHPSVNRLSAFLEISALSIALAQSGGTQYKAGFLHVEAMDGKGFGRKSAGNKARRSSKWCAVRESYLVAQEDPGETCIWDVFLLDSDFTIEQPKRYYRQGLNLLNPDSFAGKDSEKHNLEIRSNPEHTSLIGTIKGTVSRIFKTHSSAPIVDDTHQAERASNASSDASSDSSASTRPPTPMLDPSTNRNPLSAATEEHHDDFEEHGHPWKVDTNKRRNAKEVSRHTFFISNSQMRLKLSARNERQMLQWITALEKVAASCHFTGSNRFDSFAPIRLNVSANWLVDGRDYFWNLSRAILLAQKTIYIHDWWLSPELQLRRPNKDKYRLDHLLERKAKEGIKIYIIVYQEVSSRTTPTDSNYTKQRLTSLHPNILVQRSPSHFQTGTFYWAHHEKLCVIDEVIAFMGGLDLCFGRWDSPQHALTDEEYDQIWPGKDYSNPRVVDFHTLHKPEEDMYDRSKVPRMPWHDVGMQVVGQPARDLARHFVQRWNYLLRIKNHTRLMPFLLPPPEFKPGELTQMRLTGTCELQICRSTGPWSIGTPGRIEQSIQTAYLKAIQLSEHFVYMENQFFITSTVVNDMKIENKIGDALVHRIVQAHRDKTPWKCCIVIPLLPGFTFPVDHSDASAIRIILECQNRTIARGPNSIFARLRKEGIDPDDYISIFSLRNWAKFRGDVLTTEQVYIHGKVCIVDDRLAIIGSANINERSQRGDRDSEIAAVIRDTDMIESTMGGKPFKVGRFAHTLRVRLMREHVGVDVDALTEDPIAHAPVKPEHEQEVWDPDTEQQIGQQGVTRIKKSRQRTPAGELFKTTLDGLDQAIHATGEAGSNTATKMLKKVGAISASVPDADDEVIEKERQTYTRSGKTEPGFASAIVPTLEEKMVMEQRNSSVTELGDDSPRSSEASTLQDGVPQARTKDGKELFGAPADASTSPQTDNQPPHGRSGIDDANEEERAAPGARAAVRKHLASKLGSKVWTLPTRKPQIDPHGFEDPVVDSFWKDIWVATAVHNTEIFRKVFHAIPDDLVTTWKQYREFVAHHERMNKPPRDKSTPDPIARVPSETGDQDAPGQDENLLAHGEDTVVQFAEDVETAANPSGSDKDVKGKKPSRGTEPFEKWERDEMEKLLREVCGHLVVYPTRFLEGEDVANNFLFNADRLLPLPIYD